MATIDEQLIQSAGMQLGTPPVPQEPVMGTENNEAPTNQPSNEPAPTGMDSAEQPTTPPANETNIPQQAPIDYDKILSELSGGTFKNAEEFKASLPKVSEYDRLKQERDEFEAKTKQDPFVNPYVKKLNELYQGGATPDQIENFQKINKVGDISALSPVDAKIAKMVLVDGYREEVAKLIVSQDFPLEDYEEGSPGRQIEEEKLRVSALTDKKALEAYKAEASTPSLTNSAEEARLQQVAAQAKHNEYVKQQVPAIAQQIKGMGELSFKPKEGDAVKMNFEYPSEYKAQMTDKLFEYFSDGQTEINQQSVADAFKAINATYLDENFPAIAQKIFEQGYNVAEERASNKYENRSGLPQGSQVNIPNVNNEQAFGDFLKKVAGVK